MNEWSLELSRNFPCLAHQRPSGCDAQLTPVDMSSKMLRSETMSLVQLYIPTEHAHSVVNEIGELSVIQFRDVNISKLSFTLALMTLIAHL